MMNFFRWITDALLLPPQRALKVEDFLSRESLGIDPYPEDPKVTEILVSVRQQLKALPFNHRHIDVTIYLSWSTEQAIINLENERAFHLGHLDHILFSLDGISLYGYSVHVSPDDLMDGKDAHVVYTPE